MSSWTRIVHPAAYRFESLTDKDGSPISWDTLRHESNRLETFVNDYAFGVDDHIIALSENGFAYDRMTGKIVCVFCRSSQAIFLVKKNEDVEEFHKRLSPRCPMVTGAPCGNVTPYTAHLNTLFRNPTIPAIDYSIGNIPWRKLNEEPNRIRTFAFHPEILIQNAMVFTSKGFAYIPHEDSITCAFCGESLPNTLPNLTNASRIRDRDVLEAHRQLAPNCPMVTGERCYNLPAVLHLDPRVRRGVTAVRSQINPNQPLLRSDRPGVTGRFDYQRPRHLGSPEYGINYHRPNYPQSRSQRITSFNAVPNFDPTPLIEQGFFYHPGKTGEYPSSCRCYYCGFGFLVSYVADHLDDIPFEHALMTPDCPAVAKYCGETLIKLINEMYREYYRSRPNARSPTVNDVRGQLAAQNITLQFNTQPPSAYPDNLSNPQDLDPAVVVAMARGYSQAEAVQAAQTMIDNGQTPRSDEIINIITGQNQPPPLAAHEQALADSIEAMRASHLCDVCAVKDKDTGLLPCHHLFCHDCAESLTTCPMCRRNIQGSFKFKRS